MTGTKLPGIRKALSDALTSEAFLEEAGITRAAAEEAMALCRWEEALPTLFPVTGRYTCRQLFDQCSDAMNFLSPEPEGGWMPFTYRFVCHILYPEADFTESAAPYRAGAILYLTVLRFFFDEERKVVPFDPMVDYAFLTDAEARSFDTYEEYKRFLGAWHREFVYEMMRLNAEVTTFNTLEHIAGVHYVALTVARGMYKAGAPIDLALVSGSAAAHDIGKFGCKPNENVPYMHYYYTDIWCRAHELPYIGHVAANHSNWDLEPENLSIESLTLIYSDFRVKQSRGPDGIPVTYISSLAEAFDIILNKLDNVDEKKALRYRFVYAKLADFENWMISCGADTKLDGNPPEPEVLPDVVLRTPEEIVRSLVFMAIEHNVDVMHRMSAERQFGELLEAAGSEKDWKNVRAYLNIFREYFTYTSDTQKERLLGFLYELFMYRDGEIRVQSAELLGEVIAQFNAGYKKRRPEGIGDAAQEHVLKIWNHYIWMVLNPDRKLMDRQQRRINSQLKNILQALTASAEADDLPLFMEELLRHYDVPEKQDDAASFALLNAVEVFPFDRMKPEDIARAGRFAAAKCRTDSRELRTAAWRVFRQIAEHARDIPYCAEIRKLAEETADEDDTALFLRYRVLSMLGADVSALEEKLYQDSVIPEISLDSLKTGTTWLVKSVNVKLLADQVLHRFPEHAMHVAVHFSNMIKVGQYMLVRRTAGEALIRIMPILTADQRNEIVVEMIHGLQTGGSDYSRSIPHWLGQAAAWLPPAELEEVVAELHILLARPEDHIVEVSLDTIGALIECCPEYETRFPEAPGKWRERLERLVGMVLTGMASYRERVCREAMLVLGQSVFGTAAFTRQQKEQLFARSCRKILFQLSESRGGEMTGLYRAAALASIYRFITEYRILEGEFRMKMLPRVAFFPGTFDPFTRSHKGIARMIRDLGFEVYLSVDEYSWSKNAQPYGGRRRIVNMSIADELHINLFPADLPLNPGNPEDMRELKKLFPGRDVYIAVGSDVVAGASYYRNPKEGGEICSMNHIVFRRPGAGKEFSAAGIIRGDLIELELPPELEEISSSGIRENIERNRDISDLVDPVVEEYIYNRALYLGEAEFKQVVRARPIDFREERIGENIRLSIVSGGGENRELGAVTYRFLAPDQLYGVLKDVERADMIRRHSSGKILLINGFRIPEDSTLSDAVQLLLTEAVIRSYEFFCEAAVFCPEDGNVPREITGVLFRQGFLRVNPVTEPVPVLVTDTHAPLLLLENMETVLKEPFSQNPAVLKAIRKGHENLKNRMARLFPGQVLLPVSAGVLFHRLTDRITELNGVPREPAEPRKLGPLMCVPYGKIIRGRVIPNTVTKTLYTDRVYEPDLQSNCVEAFPEYPSLETQVRIIHSFRRPVILVDDVLNRNGLRIGTLEPLLRKQGVEVEKVLLGILTGYGKDSLERAGFDSDCVYFIPNMRYWFLESSLYPFIGGDAVRRKEVKVAGLAPSINLIHPYTQPPLEEADPEALYAFSECCMENARDILKTLEQEYRLRYSRNLTLSRLAEAVNLPVCPDRGAYLTYDPNLPASGYVEGDLELLRRLRVNTRESTRRRSDLP